MDRGSVLPASHTLPVEALGQILVSARTSPFFQAHGFLRHPYYRLECYSDEIGPPPIPAAARDVGHGTGGRPGKRTRHDASFRPHTACVDSALATGVRQRRGFVLRPVVPRAL